MDSRRLEPGLAAWLVFLALPSAAALPGWERLEVEATDAYAWLYVPAAALAASEPLPLTVFFHGSGSQPEPWQPILQPFADATDSLLLLPRSLSSLSFGIEADEETVIATLDLAAARLADLGLGLDRQRVGLAGHSAGGAYALVLAYAERLPVAAVFALGSPFRLLLDTGELGYVPPARLYYGTADPNYSGGSFQGWFEMLTRLDVELETDLVAGGGHSGWDDRVFTDGLAFLLAARHQLPDPPPPPGPCEPSDTRLCLGAGRFAVEGSWSDPRAGSGSGPARVVTFAGAPPDGDSGLLWFFTADNWELTVKVLDGCSVNDHHWVFFSGLSNVGYELTVRDLVGGGERTYTSPQGTVAPVTLDTIALPCP